MPTIRTESAIEQNLNDFLESHQKLNNAIGNEVFQLKDRLRADMERGHLDAEQFDQMINFLYDLCLATNQLNLKEADQAYHSLENYCSYHPVVKSKWVLLGMAIGALIEAAAMAVASILAPNTIPLLAMAINISCASFIGAVFGYKVGELKAKNEMSNLMNHSVCGFFQANHVQGAKQLDHSWTTWFKQLVHLSDAEDTKQTPSIKIH